MKNVSLCMLRRKNNNFINSEYLWYLLLLMHDFKSEGNCLFMGGGKLRSLISKVSAYEISVNFYKTTQRNMPEDSHLQVHFKQFRVFVCV
jgi:hypothetical protein